MKILQSNIERILYVTLLMTFVAATLALVFSLETNNRLAEQQKQFHNDSAANLEQIEKNQVAQSKAIKVYIDCLIKIDPKGNVPAQEQVCFNGAPEVKDNVVK